LDAKHLLLSHHVRTRIFKAEQEGKGIAIQYQTFQ
jgi:hypothetical protein